jgi:diadenosine tetraphosphate (Ap4A) HIT family hydrolase
LNKLDCPWCWKIETIDEFGASDVIWRFPHSVALLGMWQYYQGYTVLVSRHHATELNDLPTEERRVYLDEMCLMAQAIQTCYKPHKLNYELLGNQVPHLHWHLFPRYSDDPERMSAVWLGIDRAEREGGAWRRRMETGREERATTATKLRNVLQQMGAPQA